MRIYRTLQILSANEQKNTVKSKKSFRETELAEENVTDVLNKRVMDKNKE